VTSVAERAATLHAAGLAASESGRPVLAARRLRAGLRLIEREGGAALAELRGRLLVSLAFAEAERGHVELGFRLLDDAQAALPERSRAVAHAQRAAMLRRNGRNDLALPEFAAAIAGLTERDAPRDLVKALNNRGILHLEAGHISAAREDLARSRHLAIRHGLDRSAALALLNRACLEAVAGDFPVALRAFTEARAEFERVAPTLLSVLGLEQARALLATGLFREADAALAAAMPQAYDQRQGHTYADLLQVRAAAALLGGRPREAGDWARQAHREFVRRRNPRQAALAALLAVRADLAAGERVGERARRLAIRFQRLNMPEDARVAALVAARASLRSGRWRNASRLAPRFGPPARTDRMDTRLLWRLTQAEIANAAGRQADAFAHLRTGMATLHRHRVLLGSLDLQTAAAVHGRDLARTGLAVAVSRGSIPAVYRWSERARAQASLLPSLHPPDDPAVASAIEELRHTRFALREAEVDGRPSGDLRARAERLQRTVRELSWSAPGREATTGPVPASLGEVRAELADAALVAFLSDGEALRALVVTGAAATLVPLGDPRRAEEAVLRLRADLDAQAGRALPRRLAAAVAAATARDAAELARTVVDPLWRLIGDREVVVAPTGLLMTTPWAVLPGFAGRPVTVAPSATAWLSAVRRRRRSTASGTVLVSGPGIARGAQEVETIGADAPHATVLTGSAATPAAALAAMTGAAVAHMAAHGRHQAENALFSTVELSGGSIFGYDLQRLTRPPALIMLSSCELGLNDVRPGNESIGMASALLAAGTATVIASVSRVADDTAMAVAVDFHRGVAAGQAPASALAAADSSAGFICLGAG
jgi:tetratricopeptide (TPR) repeat protein